MKKITLLIAGFLYLGLVGTQAGELIRLDRKQFTKLGIVTDRPAQVSAIWSKNFPARITVPNSQVRVLSSLQPGLVNRLTVAEGDRVHKGQILVEISSPSFLEVQQDYLDALARLKLVENNHARNKNLFEEGIISEKRFATSRTELNEARTLLSRRHQGLLFSGMSAAQITTLRESRKLNNKLLIRSPFDGTVLKQVVRTGQHVDEATALYHLGNLNPLWVEIYVPVSFRTSVDMGNRFNIQQYDLTGKLIAIGRMIRENDQTILLRGSISDGAKLLTPGQFVEVRVEQNISRDNPDTVFRLFRIPQGAIFREASENYVFVAQSGGFIPRKVKVMADEGQTVVIRGDLTTSDDIAVRGIATLKGILQGLGSEE